MALSRNYVTAYVVLKYFIPYQSGIKLQKQNHSSTKSKYTFKSIVKCFLFLFVWFVSIVLPELLMQSFKPDWPTINKKPIRSKFQQTKLFIHHLEFQPYQLLFLHQIPTEDCPFRKLYNPEARYLHSCHYLSYNLTFTQLPLPLQHSPVFL